MRNNGEREAGEMIAILRPEKDERRENGRREGDGVG